MATIKFHGDTVNTSGNIPQIGEKIPNFNLVKNDLSRVSGSQYQGQKYVLNIFPSIDTGVCATSVRTFNKKVTEINNIKVLCVSRDLPFAFKRFCGAEGINNVETLSDYDGGQFGKDFQVAMTDGPLKGLLARAIVVVDENGIVTHSELVKELTDEPDYNAALTAL